MIQHLTEIVEEARKRGKKRLAVAYGQDSHTLEAVYEAYKEGLVEPTLFGDKEVIKQVCQENGIDINAFNIVNEPNDVKCVQQAVASVVSGNADVLMKGLVSTDKYMRGILNKEALSFDETNSAYVLMESASGEMERVYVETGVDNDNYVEITSGLEDGDTVYVLEQTQTSSGGGLLSSL